MLSCWVSVSKTCTALILVIRSGFEQPEACHAKPGRQTEADDLRGFLFAGTREGLGGIGLTEFAPECEASFAGATEKSRFGQQQNSNEIANPIYRLNTVLANRI